jgi:uncharacterized protein YodC (DUF2158 family)
VLLQIGEVVRLRSGGPRMTVVARGARAEPGAVECAWFDKSDAYAVAGFPLAALERVNSTSSESDSKLAPRSQMGSR